MKKLNLIALLMCLSLFSVAQYQAINNGESGLSVRNKLNTMNGQNYSYGAEIQFSPDKTSWDNSYIDGTDKYVRFSTMRENNFTGAFEIGFDGDTIAYYVNLAIQPYISDTSAVNELIDSILIVSNYFKIYEGGSSTPDSVYFAGGGAQDSIILNGQPTKAHNAGVLYFDSVKNNLVFFDNNNEVALDVGKEGWIDVYNNSGDDIENGAVCVLSGNGGSHPSIKLAKADVPVNVNNRIGVATHKIEAGTYGRMTIWGNVRDYNTAAYSTGQKLFLSATTAGALTSSKPSFPYYRFLIATVDSVGVNGSINVDVIGSPSDIVGNIANGSTNESFDFVISSDGSTITGTLTDDYANGYLTINFSNGLDTINLPASISLTAGADDNPQINYVYILESTRQLAVSTSYWPSAEHVPISVVVVQSAATVATGVKAIRNQNINNHLASTDGMGGLDHIRKRIRTQNCEYEIGVDVTVTGNNVTTTSGLAWQMHLQAFDALDLSVDSGIVVNDFTGDYRIIDALNDITTDANGGTLNNNNYSIVLWGVQNSTTEPDHLMFNVPTGTYNNTADAIKDENGYTTYNIPKNFRGVGFLIARLTFDNSGGTWTLENSVDLRGSIPSNVAGGSSGGGGVTSFTGLTDTPSTIEEDKLLVGGAGGTALEFEDVYIVDGNVGIGTDSPTEKLDVDGNANISDTIKLSYDEDNHASVSTDVDGNLNINQTGTTVFLGDSARNVEQATNSRLTIVGTNAAVGVHRIDDTVYGAAFRMYKARGNLSSQSTVQSDDVVFQYNNFGFGSTGYKVSSRFGAAIGSGVISDLSMPGYIFFKTTPENSIDPIERLRIDQDGNVGIGTTAPAKKLHVHNSSSTYLKITNDDTGEGLGDGLHIGYDTDESAVVRNQENSDLKFYTNGNERVNITSTGEVEFGGTIEADSITFNGTNYISSARSNDVFLAGDGTYQEIASDGFSVAGDLLSSSGSTVNFDVTEATTTTSVSLTDQFMLYNGSDYDRVTFSNMQDALRDDDLYDATKGLEMDASGVVRTNWSVGLTGASSIGNDTYFVGRSVSPAEQYTYTWQLMLDEITNDHPAFDEQTLSSSGTTTMDVDDGFNAKTTLSGDITVTLSNTQNGISGVIVVTGGAVAYDLTINGYWNDGEDTHEITAGVRYCIAYHVSNGNLYLNIQSYS